MGDWYQTIVARDVSADEAPALAEQIRDWLIERGFIQSTLSDCVLGGLGYRPGSAYAKTLEDPTDASSQGRAGLQIKVDHRIVFDTVDGEVTCQSCKAQVDLVEHGEPWVEAVDAWYGGDEAAAFACPACARPERLTEWNGPRPWGFGSLGLEFWNWAPLSDRFVREVTEKLGHRTLVVRGKL
jgi:hypothetical protein